MTQGSAVAHDRSAPGRRTPTLPAVLAISGLSFSSARDVHAAVVSGSGPQDALGPVSRGPAQPRSPVPRRTVPRRLPDRPIMSYRRRRGPFSAFLRKRDPCRAFNGSHSGAACHRWVIYGAVAAFAARHCERGRGGRGRGRGDELP